MVEFAASRSMLSKMLKRVLQEWKGIKTLKKKERKKGTKKKKPTEIGKYVGEQKWPYFF